LANIDFQLVFFEDFVVEQFVKEACLLVSLQVDDKNGRQFKCVGFLDHFALLLARLTLVTFNELIIVCLFQQLPDVRSLLLVGEGDIPRKEVLDCDFLRFYNFELSTITPLHFSQVLVIM
jgi:hypothetical protein